MSFAVVPSDHHYYSFNVWKYDCCTCTLCVYRDILVMLNNLNGMKVVCHAERARKEILRSTKIE